MKYYLLATIAILSIKSIAQETFSKYSDIKKDSLGISQEAPKGVYQYAFRIGEWGGVSKDLLALNQWKNNTAHSRFYIAKNGTTFIEEGLDGDGNITHTVTYDYIEKTDSWNNLYKEVETGVEVKYTSKVEEGKMVETIIRSESTNKNTYTIIDNNIITYIARRTYKSGFKIVTHAGIYTKIID